jgi:hypothetical protein
MTFEEIAPVVDRSVVATRQLASRARRRVQGQAPTSDADLRKQRRVVDAFLAAVQDGDFEAPASDRAGVWGWSPTLDRMRT